MALIRRPMPETKPFLLQISSHPSASAGTATLSVLEIAPRWRFHRGCHRSLLIFVVVVSLAGASLMLFGGFFVHLEAFRRQFVSKRLMRTSLRRNHVSSPNPRCGAPAGQRLALYCLAASQTWRVALALQLLKDPHKNNTFSTKTQHVTPALRQAGLLPSQAHILSPSQSSLVSSLPAPQSYFSDTISSEMCEL
ncbi:hypothetical protein TWF694_003214 [Orbilia ellipsospora]|uniref:Uncharacterized protein n=1 Tax=Orbilia ellipsospora TaxID=2528407 RepID=A0AAV9X260_9PEZI